jgi:hypothetical protein
MIGSTFFHQTHLAEQVARIANNEHGALPKSANMKTQTTTPTLTLSFWLKNTNDKENFQSHVLPYILLS